MKVDNTQATLWRCFFVYRFYPITPVIIFIYKKTGGLNYVPYV